MNPDDDLLLNAYVDGELPPDQRSRLESAMRSVPEWTERAREIHRVGEIVGGLSRPAAARDQSPEIMAELYRRRSVFHWIGWFERPLIAKSLVLFGAAASLVACAAIGLALSTRALNGPDAHFQYAGVIHPSKNGEAKTIDPSAPINSTASPASSARATDDKLAGHGTEADSKTMARRASNPDADQVRRLLQSPNLTTRFVVTDVVGGDAPASVGRYLRKAGRRKDTFARITLDPGNTVDPLHPGEATVFVVVLDPRELASVRSELESRFTHRFAESKLDAPISERLAQLDNSLIEQGTQVANVVVPKSEPLASIAAPNPRDEAKIAIIAPRRPVPPSEDHQEPNDRPAEPKPKEPAADPASTLPKESPAPELKNVAETPPPIPRESVVLIWVKTRGTAALPPLGK